MANSIPSARSDIATSSDIATPSTQDAGANPRLRSVPARVNWNTIRKMLPQLSAENADRWFDDFEDALISEGIEWILEAPETTDRRAAFLYGKWAFFGVVDLLLPY